MRIGKKSSTLQPKFRPGSHVYYYENKIVERICGSEVQSTLRDGIIAETIQHSQSFSYKLEGNDSRYWNESVLIEGQTAKPGWLDRLKFSLGISNRTGNSRKVAEATV